MLVSNVDFLMTEQPAADLEVAHFPESVVKQFNSNGLSGTLKSAMTYNKPL